MKALLIRKFANLRSGLAVLRPMQALRAAPSLRTSSTGPASGCVATASQTTDTVLMVSPKYFHMNAATATDNKYQNLPRHLEQAGPDEVSSLAMREFTGLVSLLRDRGVQVNVEEPPEEHRECADAVFPNNWVSFHKGKIALYPMKTENRRKERRQDVIERWSRDLRAEVVDYSSWEREGKFLEGTGSMVLDRVNKVCYACISQRTHPAVLAEFCKDFGYKAVTFEATQEGPDGELWPVYHTNVICSVGDSFALLCTECIRDTEQRRAVVDAITSSGKELVDVKEKQVYDFAANSLQLHSTHGERLLVMSTAAYQSFDAEQLEALHRHVNHLLHVPLPTIEALGGGGARCMLAEVFS